MKCLIFNKKITVDISDDFIRYYEKYVHPFNANTAEYLAVGSGCDEEDSVITIEQGIIDGIKDEVALYKQLPSIIQQIMEYEDDFD